MTTTLRHIEDLDRDAWAALTKRAAAEAVAAAQRLGQKPAPVVAIVAAMTERDLLRHRARYGPGRTRLSPLMRLVEADQSRLAAERRAREAEQDTRDAQAAAAMARAEADQSARAVTEARGRTRVVEEQAARADLERAAERAAAQQALEEVRAELELARADATADAAEAHEQLSAAEARAEQRTAERTAERAAAQQGLQEVRAELERARGDAAADAAEAHEQLSAAEARTEQRSAERTAERGAAQQALQEVRGELERVRADAAAEVAAARGQAIAEVAAAHRAAEAEVARARAEAGEAVAWSQAEVERVRAESAAEVAAVRQTAHAEVARARAEAEDARLAGAGAGQTPQLLTVPIPPSGVRANTGRIEEALWAVRQIDDVLEAGVADDARSRGPLDVELVRGLVRTVEEQAGDLSQDLRDLPSRYITQWQVGAAAEYARAAANAYAAFLQRITAATEELSRRGDDTDAEVAALVTAMLGDHPWRRR